MDNFLSLSDKEKEPKKANSEGTYVDKGRIQRLKRNFLPSWMRWSEQEEQKESETSSTKRPNRTTIEPR